MKRRKEIFLDFTALLDIMMLILFFFVLFSHLDNEKAMHAAEDMRSAAQSAMTAADGKIAEAEKREQKAAERETAANALIARYQQADSQRAADLSALEDFNSGRNLRMNTGSMIDDDVLLDLNSCTFYTAARLGVSLTHVTSLLVTHPHSDHLTYEPLYWRIAWPPSHF